MRVPAAVECMGVIGTDWLMSADRVVWWVTQQQIADQRASGWPDFHPEDFCHRCGQRNVSWYTASEDFYKAKAQLGDEMPGSDIICIACFVEALEAAEDRKIITVEVRR